MSEGESDLGRLLASLKVVRRPGRWVFETQTTPPDLTTVAMAFAEAEGWTLIRGARAEDRGPVWAWLELSVHSSLEAVGFFAAISHALADAGVPCNAISAYYHDHIFVPEDNVTAAIGAIEALRR